MMPRKPKKLAPIHPGEVLREEFLKPMGITQYRLAKDIDVPQTRISEIVKERRGVSAETALRLSRYFGVSDGFWIGLQGWYDIEVERDRIADDLESIPRVEFDAAV